MFLQKRSIIRSISPRNLVIDWKQPITRNLLGCWMPGVMGPYDIARKTPPFTIQANASLGTTIEGGGLKSTASTLGGYQLVVPAIYKSWSELTLYYRGTCLGIGGSYAPYFTLTYNDVVSDPYNIAGIDMDSAGFAYRYVWNDNSGQHGTQSSTNAPVPGQTICICATFVVGGVINFYVNGILDSASGNAFTGAYVTTATSTLVINSSIGASLVTNNCNCNMAAIWNRAISATEALQLGLSPYSFIASSDDDILTWVLPQPPPASILFAQACL